MKHGFGIFGIQRTTAGQAGGKRISEEPWKMKSGFCLSGDFVADKSCYL